MNLLVKLFPLLVLNACYSSTNQSQSFEDTGQLSCVVPGDICLQYRHQPDDVEKNFLKDLCKGLARNISCDRRYFNLDCKKDITYTEQGRNFKVALFEHKPTGACSKSPYEDDLDGVSNDVDPSKPGAFLK